MWAWNLGSSRECCSIYENADLTLVVFDDGWEINSSCWGDGSLGIARQSVSILEQSEQTPQRFWPYQLLATCGVCFDNSYF